MRMQKDEMRLREWLAAEAEWLAFGTTGKVSVAAVRRQAVIDAERAHALAASKLAAAAEDLRDALAYAGDGFIEATNALAASLLAVAADGRSGERIGDGRAYERDQDGRGEFAWRVTEGSVAEVQAVIAARRRRK